MLYPCPPSKTPLSRLVLLVSSFSSRPSRRVLTKLVTLSLFSLLAASAQAQNNTGGNIAVQDQQGNAIYLNQDGSGYPLKGPLTGTYSLSGTYPSVLAAAQKPNPTYDYSSFTPNPSSYQFWLFNSGSTPPGGGYDPYHIWTNAAATNDVGVSGGVSGYENIPGGGSFSVNGSVTANVGGTLWAIFQWSDPSPASYYAAAHATPPPMPKYLDILLSTAVNASATASPYGSPSTTSGLSASAVGGDSLNEKSQATFPALPTDVLLVTGKHLLRVPVDPATGKAPVSLSGTTTASATDSVLYGAFVNYPGTSYQYYQQTNGPTNAMASAYIGGVARLDDREVIIQSNLGQTFHKGVNASRVPNVRQSDGTMTDDTISAGKPEPSSGGYDYGGGSDFPIIYQAVPIGNWGANSSYTWSNIATQWITSPATTLHGTFNPNPISPLYVTYYDTPSSLPGAPGTTDNVRILLTDGQDGATAVANYNLKFHKEYENIAPLTDTTQNGVWEIVSPFAVSGPNGGPFPLQINASVSVVVDVTPSGLPGLAVAEAYNVVAGGVYSTAIPRDASRWIMPPNKYCWIINQPYWEHLTGTIDNYEQQGYIQQISWALDKPYNIANPLSNYGEQLVASDGPPVH